MQRRRFFLFLSVFMLFCPVEAWAFLSRRMEEGYFYLSVFLVISAGCLLVASLASLWFFLQRNKRHAVVYKKIMIYSWVVFVGSLFLGVILFSILTA